MAQLRLPAPWWNNYRTGQSKCDRSIICWTSIGTLSKNTNSSLIFYQFQRPSASLSSPTLRHLSSSRSHSFPIHLIFPSTVFNYALTYHNVITLCQNNLLILFHSCHIFLYLYFLLVLILCLSNSLCVYCFSIRPQTRQWHLLSYGLKSVDRGRIRPLAETCFGLLFTKIPGADSLCQSCLFLPECVFF